METKKPLEGIRVVEMSTMIASPSTGRLLACLGAEVIKVEALDGEPYRSMTFCTDNQPAIFDILNAQKKSVSLNAKDPNAAALLKKLIATSDVYFSNIRAESLARLGLDYPSLRQDNPQLIYAHFSGYGEKGPMANLPGYDSTSFLTRNGLYRDFTSPDHEPVNHVLGLGDMISGLALALNILAAVIKRKDTGEGEKIECSLNEVGAWVMVMPMVYEQFGSWFQRKERDPLDVANTSMRCKDGEWIFYSCGTYKQWTSFCRAIGCEELLSDPRCATLADVVVNTPALFSILARRFLDHPAEEWVGILRQHDVPCERHRHVSEMATDEQLIANRFIYPAQYGSKAVMCPAPPLQFASMSFADDVKGEPLGAHTEELLKSVGCSDELFERLKAQGNIVAQ